MPTRTRRSPRPRPLRCEPRKRRRLTTVGLCGELELPYALLGFLTDYANGVKDEATPVETLVEMMAASTETFASILRAALPHAAATTPAPAGIVYRIGA